MATSPSLFGGSMSPQEMQSQLLNQRAAQFAQLDPNQQLGMMAYKAGSGIGTGLAGAFGVNVQDPTIQRATKLRELAGQYNTNTATGLRQMADALRTTDPDMALQLSQKAAAMDLEASKLQTEQARQMSQEAQAAKALAEQGKILRGEAKDEQLRAELAALPMDADDKAVESVVRKYGKPDDIFKTLERKSTAEANRLAKAELEREKAQQREIEKQRDMDFKMQLAAMNQATRSSLTGVQREIAQARLDELRSKQTDKEEKKEAAKQFAINHAGKVVQDVAAAKSLVSGTTSGLTGKAAAFVPGTNAYDLQQRLLTIKANLGFDRLQQMRDASPTGGALGQVAVQELQALQATVGSLELGQSRQELQKNLDKIDLHYNNWLKTVGGTPAMPATPATVPANAPAAAPAGAATGGWSIRPR
jgi:hypothetical protein